MNKEKGIVTLCDANYFPGLKMLYRSIQESGPYPVVCFDVGLTEDQRVQCRDLHELKVLPLPQDPLIELVKREMRWGRPLAKRNKRVWPLWICPVLIKHAPFRDVIWMDCDLVVLRNLTELYGVVEEGPFFTPENKAPEAAPNHPDLYTLLPIGRDFDRLVPAVNAGVSGWRKERDAAALEAYIFPVDRAVRNKAIREAISWHDQGALIWAIQYCGLEHRVLQSTKWNLCVDHTTIAHSPITWDENFLVRARAQVPDANVIHWNGAQPPWTI